MKKILLQQFQQIADKAAAGPVRDLAIPREGWIRTMRKALGMSGAQLGRRVGVSRAQIAQSERNETSGAITLRTLQNLAEAMGGRLVYAIVPAQSTETLVSARATEKARQIVGKAATHMALEKQSLSDENHAFEIKRLQAELLSRMPKDLWDDV